MAMTINTANRTTYTNIPLPVVGVHLKRTNPRKPPMTVVTPRSVRLVFSFSVASRPFNRLTENSRQRFQWAGGPPLRTKYSSRKEQLLYR